MEIARTIAEMRAACNELRKGEKTLGVVPTMGALHEGHLSLMRIAKAECDVVAATIFVNPTQFGANEDLEKYPRTFETDCELLEREGVDVVFAPSVEEMYPAGVATFVEVDGLSYRLDGETRRNLFRGVATVVTKLFNIVQPDVAVFGQKDAAQVAVLKAMVRDLDMPVRIVVGETVREKDGLAMSSRNRYMSADERKRALVLREALAEVEAAVTAGVVDVAQLQQMMAEAVEKAVWVRLEYAEVVDPMTLEPVDVVRGGELVAIAAHVGGTRLIDNLMLPARVVAAAKQVELFDEVVA